MERKDEMILNIQSSDYHDYVIKDGQFIGEFEQMYQRVSDPWSCVEQLDSFKNNLLCSSLGWLTNEVYVALDIGCGLGALTDMMRQNLPKTKWHACDISATAIEKASIDFPEIYFFVQNLSEIDTIRFEVEPPNLIVMSEVMWYILPNLSQILEEFYQLLSPGGYLVILQYFLAPEKQSYGKEFVSQPNDLIRLVQNANFEIVHEVYIGSTPPNNLLLYAKREY